MAKATISRTISSLGALTISCAILALWPICCLIAGSISWRVMAHNSLLDALENNDESQLQSRLLNLSTTPAIVTAGEKLESVLSGYEDRSFWQVAQTLRSITYTLRLETTQDIKLLREQFELFTVGMPEELASDTLVTEITTVSEQLLAIAQKNEATKEQLSLLKKSAVSLLQRFELIASDCKELFGLSFQNTREVSKSSFYQSGLLANIPVLEGLKDDINDSSLLRAEIDRAGGYVSLKGEDAATQFENALQNIRKASLELIADLDARTNQQSTLNTLLNNQKIEQSKQTKILQFSLKKLLAKLICSARLY